MELSGRKVFLGGNANAKVNIGRTYPDTTWQHKARERLIIGGIAGEEEDVNWIFRTVQSWNNTTKIQVNISYCCC